MFLQSRLREMVEYDDLSEEQVTDIPSLKIADSTKFSQGLIPAGTKVGKPEAMLKFKKKRSGRRSFLTWIENCF